MASIQPSAVTNNYKFQELARVIDATLGDVNPDGLITGQNCLSIITFLKNFPGMNEFVSKDFMRSIYEETAKSSNKPNVREHVKKILTYPRTTYLPWKEHDIDPATLERIREKTESLVFTLELVDGKVYAKCQSPENPDASESHNQSINHIVFNELSATLPADFRVNFETSHVTITNSNVVADVGRSRVEELLLKHPWKFHIKTGVVKSTTSEDWSRFSECYVITIECIFIDLFLKQFNETFNKEIKIAPHITFAIRPRSLWT